MEDDSKVIEVVEYNKDDTLYTILNNLKKTGQLDNLSEMEIMEEIKLLIEQLDLDDEYLVNIKSFITNDKPEYHRRIEIDLDETYCRDKTCICQY